MNLASFEAVAYGAVVWTLNISYELITTANSSQHQDNYASTMICLRCSSVTCSISVIISVGLLLAHSRVAANTCSNVEPQPIGIEFSRTVMQVYIHVDQNWLSDFDLVLLHMHMQLTISRFWHS